MPAYYNEVEPYAAEWLRNLINKDLIADGEIDERDIRDVTPNDIKQFTQCHFFAGIGIWSGALRAARWPDTKPVWTGSCPCQPFSSAGKQKGTTDHRHLWPAWFNLIRECQPATVFGEQVASPLGLDWLDLVQADMEGEGYAIGAVDLCAAGIGAPNIRQRAYFAARSAGGFGTLANSSRAGPQGYAGNGDDFHKPGWIKTEPLGSTGPCRLPNNGDRPVSGFWKNAKWVQCKDQKYRPFEPGAFPLANGDTGRVGRLRAYGNALNFEVAKEFAEAFMAGDDT